MNPLEGLTPENVFAVMKTFSIRDLIDERAELQPDDVFLIDPESGESITYGALKEHVATIARRLADAGAKPGESVAYAMYNGPGTAVAILGALYGGFRATAINLVAGNQAIAYALEHSESRVVMASDDGRDIIEPLLNAETPPALIAMSEAAPPPPHPAAAPPEPAPRPDSDGLSETAAPPDDPSAIVPDATLTPDSDGLLMYTSGTTGKPKGCLLTHANLISGGACAMNAHHLAPRDRALCVLPLYHINGLCVTLMGPMISGGSVVMPKKFSASNFWNQIKRYECTWFSVVPTQISYLLHEGNEQEQLSETPKHVRFGRSASAPLAPEVQRAFETRFGIPIIETMGLTETAAQILSNPLPPGTRKVGSPGIPFGCEVRIVDLDMNELPPDTEGEVAVRGPSVMKEYFKNPEATGETLTADRWFRTGDLGRKDADGYVYITGRSKELIIKGGENIAPREVDDALYSHPAVIEAAAFPRQCPNYGQRVEAGVKVEPSAGVTEDELIALCRDKLGAFKTPERVHFLPELPKGPSGKIQRRKLAELTQT